MSLFLLTLISHTIYAWALGLGLLLTYCFIYRISISRKAALEGSILLALIIFSALRFQIFLVDEVLPIFIDAFWGRFANLILCVLLWVTLRSILQTKERSNIFILLKPILIIHVGTFYLQFIVFLISGNYLDFLEPFTGEESRYLSFDSSLSGIGSFRPTGFFSEPSTYFICVLALLSLILIHQSFQKNKILFFITLLSMYLSFSTAAVIIATLFIVYLLYIHKKNLKLYIVVIFMAVLLSIFNMSKLDTLYQSQVNKADTTSEIRFALIDLASKRNDTDAIFGLGLFAVDSDIYTAAVSGTGVRREAASLNDSGLVIFLWVSFGYMGFVLFLFLCTIEKLAGRRRLILFILLSLTKISLFHPLFIFYLAASLIDNNKYQLKIEK